MDPERAKKSRLCGTTRIDRGQAKGAHEHNTTSRRMDRRTRADRFDGDMVSGSRCPGQSSCLWRCAAQGIENGKLDYARDRTVRDLRLDNCRGTKLEFR